MQRLPHLILITLIGAGILLSLIFLFSGLILPPNPPPAPAGPTITSPSLLPVTSRTPAPATHSSQVPVMTAETSPVHSEITSLPTTAGISLDGNPYDISTTGLERRVHELINQQRTISGFVPLFLDPVLSDIARDHSEDMAAWNYFAHVDPGGENPTDRGADAGYTCRKDYASYYTYGIAENLFQNNLYSSATYYSNGRTEYDWSSPEEIAQTTVSGWMNSSGHRENILTPSFDREGIGVAIAPDNKVYITEDFC